MTDEKVEELKKELTALLKKYDVSIKFACDKGSNIAGLRNDHIEIVENTSGKAIVKTDSWWLSADDLIY